MPAPQDLFQVLGISPDATDAEVQAVYEAHVAAADMDEKAVPEAIRAAFSLLHAHENRGLYADLVRHCLDESQFPVNPGAAESAFRQMCAVAGISIYEHPEMPNVYEVRLPGQDMPAWAKPKVDSPELPVRRRTAGQTALLGMACIAVVVVLVVAFRSGIGGITESPEERAAAQRRALAADLRSAHASATKELKAFDAAVDALKAEFQSVTSVTLDDAANASFQRPREIDLLLIKHESARDAWAEIVNARPSGAERTGVGETLTAVDGRIGNGSFGVDDQEAIRSARAWVEKKLKVVQSQSGNVDHIRVMLATDRFEKASDSGKRSPP